MFGDVLSINQRPNNWIPLIILASTFLLFPIQREKTVHHTLMLEVLVSNFHHRPRTPQNWHLKTLMVKTTKMSTWRVNQSHYSMWLLNLAHRSTRTKINPVTLIRTQSHPPRLNTKVQNETLRL